ncbi:MAG: hypothetical protein ACI4QS_02825 [Comamonas sp.]
MIPLHRPVLGRDLAQLQQHLGLTTRDMLWLLNLSITRWTQLVRQAPDIPVPDPSLALLVRFIAQHAQASLLPPTPVPSEVLGWMQSAQQVELKRFAAWFGNEASAGYRWMHAQTPPSATVQRLMQYLRAALAPLDGPARQQLLHEWQHSIRGEAQARGIGDPLHSGRWHAVPVRDVGAPCSNLDASTHSSHT